LLYIVCMKLQLKALKGAPKSLQNQVDTKNGSSNLPVLAKADQEISELYTRLMDAIQNEAGVEMDDVRGLVAQQIRVLNRINYAKDELQSYVKVIESRMDRSRLRIRGLIAEHDVFLVTKLLELAQGVSCVEFNKDGEPRVYQRAPDLGAVTYLLDKLLGKTPLATQDAGNGSKVANVNIYLPDNNRENPQVIVSEFIDG
jgi:hypothetical protein